MGIKQFEEQIYAGVLGKLIGVYLGRPVEGWSYEKIKDTFGEINYYVHEAVGGSWSFYGAHGVSEFKKGNGSS